jgi:Spy/CpxP family protein refolding chaperone
MKRSIVTVLLGLLILSGLGGNASAFAEPCCNAPKKSTKRFSCPWNSNSAASPKKSYCTVGFGMDRLALDWVESLGLTPEQRTAFEALKTQYAKEVTPLEEKSRASKRTLLEYLGCPSFNQATMNGLIDAYTAQKNTLLKARMDYYVHAQQLLSPQQLEKSRAFWVKHFESMPHAVKGMP